MKIHATIEWSASRVNDLCIKNGWYQKGDYQKSKNLMVEYIGAHQYNPTLQEIANVAQDIEAHTDSNLKLTDYMYVLWRDSLRAFFEIEEEEEE